VPDWPQVPHDAGDVIELARRVGIEAAPFAVGHDREGTFVHEGYEAIRASGYAKVSVPKELGGGGHGLDTICRAQAMLAGHCANTALAIAMHHHNVLALVWRWRTGAHGIESLLSRVVDEGLLLATSGTMDQSRVDVSAVPTEGGFVVNGRKGLVSGAPGVDLIGTVAAIGSGSGRHLVSVYIPMKDPGIEILPTWDGMGMRGSGSNAVQITDVFVPTENVVGLRGWGRPAIRRSDDPDLDDLDIPRFSPGLYFALPVIASVYLGIAAGARDRALKAVLGTRKDDDPGTERLAGVMTQELRTAWWALEGVIRETTDESIVEESQFTTTMLGKRQVVLSSIAVVEAAIAMLGTAAYLRDKPFEQALRDVRAGITHPLAPESTLVYTGRVALALTARRGAAGSSGERRSIPPVPPPRSGSPERPNGE
jgi:alkylation response protein AidB-like acyl-CoA dehydrogenase